MIFLAAPGSALAYRPDIGNVNAIFGPQFHRTNFGGTDAGLTSSVMRGWGVVAQADLWTRGTLELGLVYMPKLFIREQNGLYFAEQTNLVHITAGYRYWFADRFSAALAFGSSYTTGEPETIYTDYPAGQRIDTSARDLVEYSFDLSLAYEVITEGRFGVVVDGRYSWSVTEKTEEAGDHYGILVGLRYLIQTKEEAKR
ncbi:MAG TPA: hypothetical protein VFV50_02115 [Bdellovibrionales bacterium]|nr:hypothetical protein [Bdellovibrionales bacterium]